MLIDTSKNSSFSSGLGERLGHFNTTNDLFSSHFDFKSLLFENDFKAIFPELFLVTVTLSLLLYGVILSTSSKYPLLVGNLTFLALLSLLFVPLLTQNSPLQHGFIFYNTLYIDSTTLFTKSIVCWGAFFSCLISLNYLKLEGLNGFEFVILVLLSVSSMLFLIMSADFLSMYLGIEFQSLCFYVMAALKRDSEFSTEAGLKYFLLGAFSSALLLFGITLIYGFTGTTSFSDLSKLFSALSNPSVLDASLEGLSSNKEQALGVLSAIGYNQEADLGFGLHNHSTCLLGMVLITVGFLFKLTAFPFHMWAPDVYEGAPTPVTAFFSIVPKVAVLTVFVNLYLIGFYDLSVSWQKILVFSSLGSMILGSLAAMSQNKIKRLLAYSSIGHVGYLLIGLCSSTVEGIQALFIYLFIYLVMTINIFCIILLPVKRISRNRNPTGRFNSPLPPSPTQSPLSSSPQTLSKEDRGGSIEKTSLYKATPSVPRDSIRIKENPEGGDLYSGSDRIKYTTDLAFMANSHPLIALNLTLTMFSIAGIPPLAGFYSKAYLFFAALSSSQFLLAVVGVLTSVVSCFYYIRIVQIMYFVVPRTWLTFTQISKGSGFTLGLCFFFLLLFVVYPFPLYLIAHKVALTLSY